MGIVYSGAIGDRGVLSPVSRPKASLVIRTFNEARYLGKLLARVAVQQAVGGTNPEVIVVDSGSTDATLQIAESHGARIVPISKEEFTFGRSLNYGCDAAKGEILILISGHCIPCDDDWLANLTNPFADPSVAMTYGRQLPGPGSKFSEGRVFAKYYPDGPPSQGSAFCNNANSAVRKSIWRRFRYDEQLTGVEDIEFGRRVVDAGFRIDYAPQAAVYHLHHEHWGQIRRRYEREAIALRHIYPEFHFRLWEAVICFLRAVILDARAAWSDRKIPGCFTEICLYRWNQFFGSYLGNRPHREISRQEKARYFFPT